MNSDKKDIKSGQKPTNIALIGFMGTGKSTVSRALKAMLNMQELDMDALIVKQQGMPISDIFEKRGEAHFRALETQLLKDLAKSDRCIISCGGGTVTVPENVDELKKHSLIVLLTASPETIYNRVKHSAARPILNGNMNVEHIKQLMQKRAKAYEAAADITVSTDGKTVREICEEIAALI